MGGLAPVTISCPVYHNPARSPAPRQPARRAGYDIARTTKLNQKHWAEADGLSPNAQLTPYVRKLSRDRARYETQNNSYVRGAVRTLVLDTVGRGARLQMQTDDESLNRGVEALWNDWAGLTDWALTSRVMCGLRYVAGEGFAVPFDSAKLERMRMPVSFGLRLYEPDQVATPNGSPLPANGDDGIEVDENGEPTFYTILRQHPGEAIWTTAGEKADRVPAGRMMHWYEPDRPGQLRGITPLAAALGVFAQLRRFTAATLTAAEVGAMLAGVLETDMPPGEEFEAITAEDAFDTVELVQGTLLTLPSGQKAKPFQNNPPTTGYDLFVAAKLKEAGRAINMPYGKMAGDHSQYNYSSGRLDDAPYWADRDCERQALEAKFFNPVFNTFCDYARFVLPALAAFQGQWWQLRHSWQYDARPTADAVKDAAADALNLAHGSDTLDGIAARDGTTVEDLLNSRQRTMTMFRERGLPMPQWLTGVKPSSTASGDGVPQNPEDARNAAVVLAALQEAAQ